jgi:hypothetical protein
MENREVARILRDTSQLLAIDGYPLWSPYGYMKWFIIFERQEGMQRGCRRK